MYMYIEYRIFHFNKNLIFVSNNTHMQYIHGKQTNLVTVYVIDNTT